MTEENSILIRLPDHGQKVLAFGHKTFCCALDMHKEAQWHECKFKFNISSYQLKKEIPVDPEESILARFNVIELWIIEENEEDIVYGHIVGVTKWKKT